MANITDVKLPDSSQYDLKDNVSGYAKKVAGATTDDLASLTATGDLADSGKKLSDLVLKTDVKDILNSTSATDPLSANMGHTLADNLAANEESGAKNLNSLPYYESEKSENGITITSDDKGIVTASGTAAAVVALYMHSDTTPTNKLVLPKGDYTLLGCPVGGSQDTYCLRVNFGGTQYYDVGSGVNFSLLADTQIEIAVIIKSGTVLPVGGVTIKPMICDARVIDPTFAPFAETNLQLTQNKAERNDLSTIHATGSTNNSGAQIDAGTFFYLNGQFCKALTNIAANATFTLDTNFKVDSVGKEIKAVENKDTSSFSVSTESGVSLQKAICRNGFVYLQLHFNALANSTKIATITDANYLPEGGNAAGLIEPNLSAEKINYTYGAFSGSDVYVYVSGSPTSGGIISFFYPVTGY